MRAPNEPPHTTGTLHVTGCAGADVLPERVRVGRRITPVVAPGTFIDMFRRQVGERRDCAAIAGRCGVVTYRDLAKRAGTIARRLQKMGVRSDDRVALLVPRGPGLIESIVGIMASGAAYVPLDPQMPAERAAMILDDADPVAVVVNGAAPQFVSSRDMPVLRIDDAGEDSAAGPLPSGPGPERLAYVMYTSGSTGQPKGVMVEHGSLANLIDAARGFYAITSEDRVLQLTTAIFDISVEEIFPTLAAGATLVLRDEQILSAYGVFVDTCAARGVTILQLPTAFWHGLTKALDKGMADRLARSVRLVVIGGERALPDRLEQWRDCIGDRIRLVNAYGPTETTVTATWWDATGRLGSPGERIGAIPIGRPLPNVEASIRDAEGSGVPVGETGELWIGGKGVARGYLNRPDLTAERFVEVAGPGTGGCRMRRMYRTGDLARWGGDGELHFLGRMDDQVKVGGYRVEPGDVEAALSRHPRVKAVAVVATRDKTSKVSLVAYAEAHAGKTLTAADLRRYASECLPAYMVPAQVLVMDRLPQTLGGKIARRDLPDVEPVVRPDASGLRGGDAESELGDVFSSFLAGRRLGPHDDLMSQGLSSIDILDVVLTIEERFGLRVTETDLLANPTIAAMAVFIRKSMRPREEVRPTIPVGETGTVVLPELLMAMFRLNAVEELLGRSGRPWRVPLTVVLRGALDVKALTAAWDALVVRHQALRVVFTEPDGFLVRRWSRPILRALLKHRGILDDLSRRAVKNMTRRVLDDERTAPAEPDPWFRQGMTLGVPPRTDLATLDAAGCPGDWFETVSKAMEELVGSPLDVIRGPLWNVRLLSLAPETHAILFTFHHAVMDGLSLTHLVKDFAACYNAIVNRQPLPVAPSYGFLEWRRACNAANAESSGGQAVLSKWMVRFRASTASPWPFARTPQSADWRTRHTVLPLVFAPTVAGYVRELCKECRVTPTVVFLAALGWTMRRHVGHNTFCLTVPMHNRTDHLTGSLVGCLAGMAVMPMDVRADEGLPDIIAQVNARVLELQYLQGSERTQMATLLSSSVCGNQPGVFFDLRPASPRLELPCGLSMEAADLPDPGSDNQIEVIVRQSIDGYSGWVTFSPEAIDPGWCKELGAGLERILTPSAGKPRSAAASRVVSRDTPGCRGQDVSGGPPVRDRRAPHEACTC